jgi:zinc D-Ala-D-Ala carboxypeptidase
MNWECIVYFDPRIDTKLKCPLTGEEHMDMPFMKQLDIARNFSKVPFRISSGYRSEEHNRKVGGVKDSAHMKGLAVDIVADTSTKRHAVLTALLLAGFERIGIGKDFIHVDADTSKPGQVIWLYDDHEPKA